MTTRRSFLTGAAAAAVLARRSAGLWAQAADSSTQLTLSIDPGIVLATVPEDFTGLSYESAQLGHPDFFAASNRDLITLFRHLGKSGVLRIGGNTAEYTTWSANDADTAKNMTPAAIGPDAGTAAKTASILTPAAIRNLNEFVTEVGWRVLYGLNLWHGTAENAAAEAKYVQSILGDRLIAFQIGNEPDMDHDQGSKERWTFDHYWEKWQAYRDAVRKAVPNARFAGPDIAKELDWITKMAEKKPQLELLTGHYYAEGPPADPKMTLDFLLHRGKDPASGEIAIVQQATRALGRPYRMSEGNSCFHGGKPNVSDTFASALWSGDYMLQLAQAGYVGVNLHGGGNGLYTPIAGSLQDGFKARPVCYGMLLAQRFSGMTMVQATLSQQAPEQNVTAFAAKHQDSWKLALFNKAAEPASVRIQGLPTQGAGSVMWLSGPSIEAHDGVTFGDSDFSVLSGFIPRTQARIPLDPHARLDIPAYTAALLET